MSASPMFGREHSKPAVPSQPKPAGHGDVFDGSLAVRGHGINLNATSCWGVQSMEAPVAAERAFVCGNGKYYVVEQHGYLVVQRQDWLGRSFLDYARNLAEAITRIEADAHCWQIQAA